VLLFRESSRLAAAYGIAVAGTMAITSVMYFLVVRKTWSWPLGKALPLLVLFLAFDIPFVVANLGKFSDGGYVPILLGSAVLLMMVIWNRGRTLLAHRSQKRFPSREAAMARVEAYVAARVPGTAVFLNSNEGIVPNSLLRHVEGAVPCETVIILTFCTAGRPTVPEQERYRVDRLPKGFYRVVANFGFMEDPQAVPSFLKKAAKAAGIPFLPTG
jgi:KUP system potassium uptake protein